MTWRIAVDIGGTFTDLMAHNEASGETVRTKALSTPSRPAVGVMRTIAKAAVPLSRTSAFVHGSTVAINAVLQLQGAPTALFTTKGFRDSYEMGRKSRPDMYNLFFRPRMCLVPRQWRYEVSERLNARGEVMAALDDAEVRALLRALPREIQAIAVCFLHAYANQAHERRVGEIVREERPDLYLSLSTDISREFHEYERTSTAVMNAYVGPIIGGYISALRDELGRNGFDGSLLITQSNGGVMTADMAIRQPVRTMESGPAAGVTGSLWLCNQLGIQNAIAFDMGGTSAKACVIENGMPEVATEYYIGGRLTGLPVQVPFLDIVEVGAGGGSIAWIDSVGALKVGPQSAGAEPGPVCYGLGGTEPTVTDANVLVGKIGSDYFMGGEMPLDVAGSRRALADLGARLGLGEHEVANGIIRIANSTMGNAIRSVTVERGKDPRDFTLVAYGGAGPIHAVALAAELQIPSVLVPVGSSTFAAYGMLVTDLRYDLSATFLGRIAEVDLSALERAFRLLEEDGARLLREAGKGEAEMHFVRSMDLRYVGQFHPLTMEVPSPREGLDLAAEITRLFHAAHGQRYGHSAPGEPVEVINLRVAAIGAVPRPAFPRLPEGGQTSPEEARRPRRRVLFESGEWAECQVYRREALLAGNVVVGPAVIDEATTAVVLRAGDRAEVMPEGHLLITVERGQAT